MGETKKVTKRIEFSEEVYKIIKKEVIELGLDNDGKMSPQMLGQALDSLILKKINENNTKV